MTVAQIAKRNISLTEKFSEYIVKNPKRAYAIEAKANKGNDSIGNLQFLTWFENRTKNDMSLVEWQKLKDNIKSYFI